jgi:hypothetical protein
MLYRARLNRSDSTRPRASPEAERLHRPGEALRGLPALRSPSARGERFAGFLGPSKRISTAPRSSSHAGESRMRLMPAENY